MLHGEAVLLDIVFSCILANSRDLLSDHELDRLFGLVARLGNSLKNELATPDLLWDTLQERVYHRNGMQRVPLPDGLGQCVFVNDIKFAEIQSACKILEERTTSNESIYQY